MSLVAVDIIKQTVELPGWHVATAGQGQQTHTGFTKTDKISTKTRPVRDGDSALLTLLTFTRRAIQFARLL